VNDVSCLVLNTLPPGLIRPCKNVIKNLSDNRSKSSSSSELSIEDLDDIDLNIEITENDLHPSNDDRIFKTINSNLQPKETYAILGAENISEKKDKENEKSVEKIKEKDPISSKSESMGMSDSNENRSKKSPLIVESDSSDSEVNEREMAQRKLKMNKLKKENEALTVSKCSVCQKEYFGKHNLNRHRRTHHPEEHKKLLQVESFCYLCNVQFGNVGALKTHTMSHHPEAYLESLGKRKRISSEKLEAPKRKKNVEKLWICEICDKTFAYQSNVSRHKRSAHSIIPERRGPKGNGNHKCTLCNEKYAQRPNLVRHYEEKHSEYYEKNIKRKKEKGKKLEGEIKITNIIIIKR